jgi:hypothetical protein
MTKSFFAIRMKKKDVEDLAGLVAGDALTPAWPRGEMD